jgi:hypothetical protein
MMSSWRLLGNSRLKSPANIGVEPRTVKPLQQSKSKTPLAREKRRDLTRGNHISGAELRQSNLRCVVAV